MKTFLTKLEPKHNQIAIFKTLKRSFRVNEDKSRQWSDWNVG